MKKRDAFLLVLLLLLAALVPVPGKAATQRCWHEKYWGSKSLAKKYVRFSSRYIRLHGCWRRSGKRIASVYRENIVNRSFQLTKKTGYYIQNMSAEEKPLRKVSKTVFQRWVYSDDSYCAFKIFKR